MYCQMIVKIRVNVFLWDSTELFLRSVSTGNVHVYVCVEHMQATLMGIHRLQKLLNVYVRDVTKALGTENQALISVCALITVCSVVCGYIGSPVIRQTET